MKFFTTEYKIRKGDYHSGTECLNCGHSAGGYFTKFHFCCPKCGSKNIAVTIVRPIYEVKKTWFDIHETLIGWEKLNKAE